MSRSLDVVYLAGNDVHSDARVLKYMSAATRLGHRVTAFGVTRQGHGGSSRVGTSRVVVVATLPTPRERLAAKWREVRVVLRFGYDADAALQARGQVARWSAQAAAKRGWRGFVLRVLSLGGRAWYAVASRLPSRTRPAVGTDPAGRDARIEAMRGRVSWRDEFPVLVRDARRIVPLVVELAPDVVHVHDVFMLGAGADAVARLRAAGHAATLVYDAHEYVRGLAHLPERVVAAYAGLEDEYIGTADEVVTVSETLAAWLERDHGLARRPQVVLNAPELDQTGDVVPLREVVGVPTAPLLVYGGGVNAARGVDTAVRALRDLPGVHLAVVVNRVNYVVRALLELAGELGVADRLHLADYVPAGLVPRYFASASVGLSTLLHSPNHDAALTNKFCEYVQAGLPIVTSDTPAQAELVESLDLGRVYPAGDPVAFAAAVQAVLADRERLHERIVGDDTLRQRFSWAAQVDTIGALYARLSGEVTP